MASKFQSRLVGTIILVAIGVIFLPDLFDGKKQHYQEQFASIPLQPETTDEIEYETIPAPEFAEVDLPPEPVTVVIDEPQQDVQVEVTAEAIEAANQPLKVEPQPVTEPKVGNQDSAWVVQLGVFRNFDNANQLVERLRKAGYQAHVFPKQPQQGDLARVVVGPDVSKQKLSGDIKKLEELTGLKGRLVRFNPLNP
ncbi:SPOR domain-containing protein [Photobacterium rosenbergii]|uniref:SPOR domain-containing protein n=1 Tax=Photobacterium rosenbergii TaxID=294936 RepID=A0ABU3ZQU5_9GAMM|nr:SPOR domain-containing protein [Photobacterium rosenbergii]MDV5172503.1 SPOR domain-containing protein [Photobacterium rosenbergii]